MTWLKMEERIMRQSSGQKLKRPVWVGIIEPQAVVVVIKQAF